MPQRRSCHCLIGKAGNRQWAASSFFHDLFALRAWMQPETGPKVLSRGVHFPEPQDPHLKYIGGNICFVGCWQIRIHVTKLLILPKGSIDFSPLLSNNLLQLHTGSRQSSHTYCSCQLQGARGLFLFHKCWGQCLTRGQFLMCVKRRLPWSELNHPLRYLCLYTLPNEKRSLSVLRGHQCIHSFVAETGRLGIMEF